MTKTQYLIERLNTAMTAPEVEEVAEETTDEQEVQPTVKHEAGYKDRLKKMMAKKKESY